MSKPLSIFPKKALIPHTGEQLLAEIWQTRGRIERLLATANEGRILREGVRLVLCGAPNAGKSSLLNRLLGFDRAIVSAVPGTTRDTIEEFASLRGIPFRITDTAGLRETEDAVEREGVERAKRAMERADVIVRVVDITHLWEERTAERRDSGCKQDRSCRERSRRLAISATRPSSPFPASPARESTISSMRSRRKRVEISAG